MLQYVRRRSLFRGFALAITLVVTAIIIALASYMVDQSTQTLTVVNNASYHEMANYAARAGLAQAVDQINQTSGWSSGFGSPTPGEWPSPTSSPVPTAFPSPSGVPAGAVGVVGPPYLYYTVQVVNNFSSSTTSIPEPGYTLSPSPSYTIVSSASPTCSPGKYYVKGQGGVWVPPDYCYVYAIGYVYSIKNIGSPTPTATPLATATAAMMLQAGGLSTLLTNSLFADQKVAASPSAMVDTYDSSVGSYSNGLQNHTYNGSLVGSNTSANSEITLGSGSVVHGYVALPSPTANVLSAVGATYSGTVLATAVPMPTYVPTVKGNKTDVTVSANATSTVAPDSSTLKYRDLTVNNGGTAVLQTGEYDFRNVSIGSNASIQLQNSSTNASVYFSGTFSAGTGASINGSGTTSPSHLIIYGENKAGSFTMTNSKTTSVTGTFLLYAPQTTVTIGDTKSTSTNYASVYGNIIAKQITLNQYTQFHFDSVGLSNNSSGSGTPTTVYTWSY